MTRSLLRRPWILALLALITAAVLIGIKVRSDLTTRVNTMRHAPDPQIAAIPASFSGLRIALIGDLHVGEDGLPALASLLDDVVAAKPDLVLLLGDYIVQPLPAARTAALRPRIARHLGQLSGLPHMAALGNYETLSGAGAWLRLLKAEGIDAGENIVLPVTLPQGTACIRVLGDRWSMRYRYVDFPAACEPALRLAITHDPGGLFDPRVRGLAFAAHTHCGQIRLPVIGALWIPSNAPRSATCGLYRDEQREIFVTAGVGTSILPVRFGAPSQWDLITLATPR